VISKDFVASVIEELARRCNDPLEFVLALSYAGFNGYAEKKQAIKAWNRIHKDMQLPLPLKEVKK